jgi:hypothetical protein
MDDSTRGEYTQLLAPNPVYLVICLIGAAALYLFTNPFGHWVLWDASVYARALDDWQIGRNPYSLSDPSLLFVYPPVFLWAGGLLAHIFPGHSGWIFFVFLYAICSLAIPAILVRFYLPQAWLSILCAYALAALEPRFAGIGALRTGNITNVFYCTVLLAGAVGIRKNNWGYFYFAVLLIATIKLNFLIMLLLPLLIGRRQWLHAILCAAGACVAYPVQRMFTPGLYAAFQAALSHQLKHSSGYGIMGIAVRIQESMHVEGALIPYLAQLSYSSRKIAERQCRRPLDSACAAGGYPLQPAASAIRCGHCIAGWHRGPGFRVEDAADSAAGGVHLFAIGTGAALDASEFVRVL